MINSREVVRRLMKYLILVITLGFYSYSNFNNKLNNKEILFIAIMGGSIYCILDLMSPSIQLKIDKKCGPNTP